MIRLGELLRKRKKILYHFYDRLKEVFRKYANIDPFSRERAALLG
jgi:hypothetical protein